MQKNLASLQILVLMAGRGLRVSSVSDGLPKPLIKIYDRTLWEIVTRNLEIPEVQTSFFYVCREEDCEKFNLDGVIQSADPKNKVIKLKELTDGAARSALMAKSYLDPTKPLLIANSDQLFLKPFSEFYQSINSRELDGLIMSMTASGNKWSYIDENENDSVTVVKEKVQISDLATVGIYYFKRASDFIESAESMIKKDIRTNNEFYLAPVYNELIEKGGNVFHCHFGTHGENVFGLGTSEDIEAFKMREDSRSLIEGLFK